MNIQIKPPSPVFYILLALGLLFLILYVGTFTVRQGLEIKQNQETIISLLQPVTELEVASESAEAVEVTPEPTFKSNPRKNVSGTTAPEGK